MTPYLTLLAQLLDLDSAALNKITASQRWRTIPGMDGRYSIAVDHLGYPKAQGDHEMVERRVARHNRGLQL